MRLEKILNRLLDAPEWVGNYAEQLVLFASIGWIQLQSLHEHTTAPLLDNLSEFWAPLVRGLPDMNYGHPGTLKANIVKAFRIMLYGCLAIINPITLSVAPFVILYVLPAVLCAALAAASIALFYASIDYMHKINDEASTNNLFRGLAYLGVMLSGLLTIAPTLVTLVLLSPFLLAPLLLQTLHTESMIRKAAYRMAAIPLVILLAPFAVTFAAGFAFYAGVFVADLLLYLSADVSPNKEKKSSSPDEIIPLTTNDSQSSLDSYMSALEEASPPSPCATDKHGHRDTVSPAPPGDKQTPIAAATLTLTSRNTL